MQNKDSYVIAEKKKEEREGKGGRGEEGWEGQDKAGEGMAERAWASTGAGPSSHRTFSCVTMGRFVILSMRLFLLPEN